MKIQIELTAEQVEEIVRQDLMDAYELSRTLGDDDDDFLDSLDRVIKHYSNENQYNSWRKSRK